MGGRYDGKEELRGQELITDTDIVRSLNEVRSTIIDPQGREMDFLAGIKQRGSSVGLVLAHGSKIVDRVVPGSPAEFAGLQKGDVVGAVDGEQDAGRIADLLSGHERIGSPARVTVVTNGQKREVVVVRTQVESLARTEELLAFAASTDALAGAGPAGRQALQSKILELERERQYEERVAAGRLNKSHSLVPSPP